MKRLPVYILAGGRSRRFGSDKARAVVQGRPLLCHVANMLEPAAASITVVADRAGKYDDLGFRTIADRQPGLGPLGGLDTALADLPAENHWLLMCSCDAAVVRREWLQQLMAGRGEAYDAVAFRSSRWQPMPGLYARTARSTIAHCIDGGNWSMQRLLDQLRSRDISLPTDWPEHWQINTPQDLHRIQRDKDRLASINRAD